jgi:type IV secretion system protein VirB11
MSTFAASTHSVPSAEHDTGGRLERLCQAPDRSALERYLAPLREHLDDSAVTELCIQRPGEAFIERAQCWQRASLPFAHEDWCRGLARLIATATSQRVDAERPLLSATLPTGERVQLVLPPATTSGTVAIAIRRPSRERWSLAELARAGLFRNRAAYSGQHNNDHAALAELHQAGDFEGFLCRAVRARQNILLCGAAGTGKTTVTNALLGEVPPEQRLVTIEDAAELVLARHPNHVRLFYSKDNQGLAKVTPAQLLEAALRMRPDRILLAELRGEEAFEYLRAVNSGHPGSMTSIHASSATLAFEQLALLVKRHPAAREMARAEIHALLHELVDVVVHCARGSTGWGITQLCWLRCAKAPA